MKFKLPKQVTENWPATNILKEYLPFDIIRIIREYVHEPLNLFEHVQLLGNNNYRTSLPLCLYFNGKHFMEKIFNTTLNVEYFGHGIVYFNNKEQIFSFMLSDKQPCVRSIKTLLELESNQAY